MGNDPSQNFPISIIQGATLIRSLTWYDINGNPIDLTGYTAVMNFRSTVEDTGTPIIGLTSSSGIVISGSVLTFTISSTLTQGLQDGQQMVYNLFIYSPSNICTSLLAGTSIVQGSTI